MKALTFNKGNWTGEEISVRVKKDGSFKLYGYDFRFIAGDRYTEEMFERQDFKIVCDNWKEPLAQGTYTFGDAYVYMVGRDSRWNCGISREQEVAKWDSVEEAALVAGIRILCNIIAMEKERSTL